MSIICFQHGEASVKFLFHRHNDKNRLTKHSFVSGAIFVHIAIYDTLQAFQL